MSQSLKCSFSHTVDLSQALFLLGYYYGMINFQSYETKIIHDDTVNESNLGKWKTKSYTIEQTTFNKRIDLTIEELKDLLGSI